MVPFDRMTAWARALQMNRRIPGRGEPDRTRMRYSVVGVIETPDGRTPRVRTV